MPQRPAKEWPARKAFVDQIQFDFGDGPTARAVAGPPPGLERELAEFRDFGSATRILETPYLLEGGGGGSVATHVNEFWTSRQRAAHSLHEISYRACFKPQLPRFFIERLTAPGEVVYDPFMGRGTTLLEAALLGRRPMGNDINPLSRMLVEPRLRPPTLGEVERRLRELPLDCGRAGPEELLVFYHPATLRILEAYRSYFLERAAAGSLDSVDQWIRMVALNRLSGHSPGFFSVYTLPPNQAVSVKSQIKINERRGQKPEPRDVPRLILKRSKNLLSDCGPEDRKRLGAVGREALFSNRLAHDTPEIPTGAVSLVVTSPPFLDIVNYALDNWLRCWFVGVDVGQVAISTPKKLEDWAGIMTAALAELARVLRPGGHVAFEVGEVRKGSIRLEETVLACGVKAGLEPRLVVVNDQEFTKTANCWGVGNNNRGTNTNRIALFRKPG